MYESTEYMLGEMCVIMKLIGILGAAGLIKKGNIFFGTMSLYVLHGILGLNNDAYYKVLFAAGHMGSSIDDLVLMIKVLIASSSY
jgi:hypothetical protein